MQGKICSTHSQRVAPFNTPTPTLSQFTPRLTLTALLPTPLNAIWSPAQAAAHPSSQAVAALGEPPAHRPAVVLFSTNGSCMV
jgi:hypothetical protein